VAGPGPAGQQRTVDDVLRAPVEILGDRDVLGEDLPQYRCQRGHRAADRRLGHGVGLRQLDLYTIASQIGQRHHHGGEQAPSQAARILGRRPDQNTQIGDLSLGKTGGMVHARRSVSSDCVW
jgi:hypothetical protein